MRHVTRMEESCHTYWDQKVGQEKIRHAKTSWRFSATYPSSPPSIRKDKILRFWRQNSNVCHQICGAKIQLSDTRLKKNENSKHPKPAALYEKTSRHGEYDSHTPTHCPHTPALVLVKNQISDTKLKINEFRDIPLRTRKPPGTASMTRTPPRIAHIPPRWC